MNLHSVRTIDPRIQRAINALEQVHPNTYDVTIINGQVHWVHRNRGTEGWLDLDYWQRLYYDQHPEGTHA